MTLPPLLKPPAIPSSTGLLPGTARIQALPVLAGLQIGQRLNALVVATQPEKQLLQLNIQGQMLRARSELVINPGEKISLEVLRLGPYPALKLLPATDNPVLTFTRQHLPIQQSPVALISQLLQHLSTPRPLLPPRVLEHIHSLLAAVPQFKAISNGEGLSQAVRRSGLFYEARLSTDSPPPVELDRDLKGHFLRLLQTLRAAPAANELSTPLKDLLHKTEAAVANIVTHQLSSLPDTPTRPGWSLELPFLIGEKTDSVILTIREENAAPKATGRPSAWSILLEIAPPGLGQIQAKLSLSEGAISVHFNCDRQTTTALINRNTESLQQRLSAVGLAPAHLGASQGIPKPQPQLSSQLVNEQV